MLNKIIKIVKNKYHKRTKAKLKKKAKIRNVSTLMFLTALLSKASKLTKQMHLKLIQDKSGITYETNTCNKYKTKSTKGFLKS